MLTCNHSIFKLYWFNDAYVRTSSQVFTLDQKSLASKFIHLTNEAIQKKGAKFGKFESGNKLSLDDLETLVNQRAAAICTEP